MVNRQKLITMTKLALYDKHEGAADRAANDYFRHDYIYRKNLGTRISVGIGGVILLALYWLRVILVDGVDLFEIDVQEYATDSVLFIVALVAAYSLIGTVQGTREYYLVQRRLNQYQGMLRFLESTEESAKPPVAEASDEQEIERERRPRRVPRAPEPRENPAPEPLRTPPPREIAREIPRDDAPLVSLREIDEKNRRTPPPRETEAPDPLANVSARALSSSRPRTPPLIQRPPRPAPPPRPKYILSDKPPPKTD